MKIIAVVALALCATFAAPAFAADTADEANMKILMEKVKADKKLLIAANMELTDAEAKGFWPIYDGYQKELDAISKRLLAVIVDYAKAYNANSLTDDQAKKLIDDAIAVEESEAKLRRTYAGKLAKVLPGKKAARYLQIESKIRAIVRYEMAAGIPLVQ